MAEKSNGIENVDYVISKLNGKRYRAISHGHVKANGLKNLDEYRKMFPGSVIICSDVQIRSRKTCKEKYGVEYSFQSDTVKDKTKWTWFEKYGVEHPSQSDIIKQKKFTTCIEKYGVGSPFEMEDFQEKYIVTCIEKYGVRHPLQLKQFQDKYKITCLKNYGVKRPSQSNIIKQKMVETFLDNHGVENPAQSKTIYNKIRQTNLKKYGFEHPMQSELVQIKTKETNLNRYGHENPMQREDIATQFSIMFTGAGNPMWDGGISGNRSHVLSERQCIKLNDRFVGSHAHHILPNVIIYIPGELHNYISHNMKTSHGMVIINILAFQYLNGYYDPETPKQSW